MNEMDKRLLDEFQRDFPLVPSPYAEIGEKLGMGEDDVISAYKRLTKAKCISRIGAVIKPGAVGASTLAAMHVPEERLEEVAAYVSSFNEVNHNYERDHHFNLWFVATAADVTQVNAVLATIAQKVGIDVMNLPILEDYHLDLGFKLQWI